jgi:glycosyltransferase involved in cell wall biosynthesis
MNLFMILDAPMGAYHHYCSQLCNALVSRRDIAKVRLVPIFSERHRPGISAEEGALLDRRIGLEILGPGGRSKGWRYLTFFKNLFHHLRAVSQTPNSVVHLQTATGLQLLDIALVLFYRFLGIPLVRTLHERTAAERVKIPNRFERWIGEWQIKKADAVIVHDSQTRKELADLFGKEGPPVAVIPHGNYKVFRRYIPSEGDETMPENDPPVALFLGIKKHKGLEPFLQALHLLQEKGFPIKGRIVGRITPGDEALLRAVDRLKNVEVEPGYLPNAEIWRVYAQSDFVVLPYLKGTTSGGVHLAYAFKKAVIASDLACFRELVSDGETGFVVPRGNSSALAEAMIRLCRDRQARRAMGEAGFRRVSSEYYDWEKIAENTASVYALASTRKRGAAADAGYQNVLEGKE